MTSFAASTKSMAIGIFRAGKRRQIQGSDTLERRRWATRKGQPFCNLGNIQAAGPWIITVENILPFVNAAAMSMYGEITTKTASSITKVRPSQADLVSTFTDPEVMGSSPRMSARIRQDARFFEELRISMHCFGCAKSKQQHIRIGKRHSLTL